MFVVEANRTLDSMEDSKCIEDHIQLPNFNDRDFSHKLMTTIKNSHPRGIPKHFDFSKILTER